MVIPDHRKAEIDKLYAQDKSIYQVHLETGLPHPTIRAYLKATGQTRTAKKGRPPVVSPQQLAMIAQMRDDNKSWDSIMQRLPGVKLETARRAYYERNK